MKHQFTLSITFVPGRILVSLARIGAGTQAQQSRFVAGRSLTGFSGQEAISVALQGDYDGDGDVDGVDYLVFKRINYIEADNIYKSAAPSSPAPITLAPGETVSLGLLATTYGRGTVFSKSRNALVTRSAQVGSVFHNITWDIKKPNTRAKIQFIERAAGQVDSVLIAILLP